MCAECCRATARQWCRVRADPVRAAESCKRGQKCTPSLCATLTRGLPRRGALNDANASRSHCTTARRRRRCPRVHSASHRAARRPLSVADAARRAGECLCSEAQSNPCRRCFGHSGGEAGLAKERRLLSPAMPASGTSQPARFTVRSVAVSAEVGTICGRHSGGMSKSASSTGSHSQVLILKSSVRWRSSHRHVAPAARQVPHKPAIDRAKGKLAAFGTLASAAHARGATQSLWRKNRIEHESRAARDVRLVAAARSRAQCSAVRRSCQTIARAMGAPVLRSRERWFRAGSLCRRPQAHRPTYRLWPAPPK